MTYTSHGPTIESTCVVLSACLRPILTGASVDGNLHYVVADASSKAPIAAGWLDAPASAADVEAALPDPDLLVGHVAGKVGLVVIDIDTDRGKPVSEWADMVEESLGPAVCTVRTRSGGLHLYYRCDQPVRDRQWPGGEIRCLSGYTVLWDADAVLAALEGLQDAELVDTAAWPVNGQQAASRRQVRKPRPASRPSRSREESLRAAMASIPCDKLSYFAWLFVGFGLHREEHYGWIEDGLGMWVEFSKTDPARYVEGECASKWHGFDPDGGITAKTIYALAKDFGYRSGIRRRKPVYKWGKSDDLDLNGRQQQELNHWYAQAKQERASRKDGLLVQVNQSETAALMGCSRRTVVRDVAHLQDQNRMREVGQEVVRHASGGHVERVYELIPVSTRHRKPISRIPDGQQAAWQEFVEERQDVPEGPLVSMGGQIYVVIAPHITGGLPKLVPVESRAPP